MIVKIQRSLFSNKGEATMLIYNRDRRIQLILPLDPAVQEELGERPKGYFRAQTHGSELVIGELVADEDW